MILALCSWTIPNFILAQPLSSVAVDKSNDKFLIFAINISNADYSDIGYFKTGITIKSIKYRSVDDIQYSFSESDVKSLTIRVHTWFGLVRNEELLLNCN